jgi:hypothetical protein
MSFNDELKKKIEYLENEIANSKSQNLELENYLLKLKLQQMEEEMREDNHRQSLLKG